VHIRRQDAAGLDVLGARLAFSPSRRYGGHGEGEEESATGCFFMMSPEQVGRPTALRRGAVTDPLEGGPTNGENQCEPPMS
jgi:hypothetical protein